AYALRTNGGYLFLKDHRRGLGGQLVRSLSNSPGIPGYCIQGGPENRRVPQGRLPPGTRQGLVTEKRCRNLANSNPNSQAVLDVSAKFSMSPRGPFLPLMVG